MTPEQERWAEASAVLRLHGAGVHVFVAARIGALAEEGDMAGIEPWKQIASRIQQLIDATSA